MILQPKNLQCETTTSPGTTQCAPQLKAQDVFLRLTPYRAIADLKLHLVKRDNCFFTPHPQLPEYSFEIRSKDLVGAELSNPTTACNIFDFLALHFGSYEQAID